MIEKNVQNNYKSNHRTTGFGLFDKYVYLLVLNSAVNLTKTSRFKKFRKCDFLSFVFVGREKEYQNPVF